MVTNHLQGKLLATWGYKLGKNRNEPRNEPQEMSQGDEYWDPHRLTISQEGKNSHPGKMAVETMAHGGKGSWKTAWEGKA
jgi:hypothetical protein